MRPLPDTSSNAPRIDDEPDTWFDLGLRVFVGVAFAASILLSIERWGASIDWSSCLSDLIELISGSIAVLMLPMLGGGYLFALACALAWITIFVGVRQISRVLLLRLQRCRSRDPVKALAQAVIGGAVSERQANRGLREYLCQGEWWLDLVRVLGPALAVFSAFTRFPGVLVANVSPDRRLYKLAILELAQRVGGGTAALGAAVLAIVFSRFLAQAARTDAIRLEGLLPRTPEPTLVLDPTREEHRPTARSNSHRESGTRTAASTATRRQDDSALAAVSQDTTHLSTATLGVVPSRVDEPAAPASATLKTLPWRIRKVSEP